MKLLELFDQAGEVTWMYQQDKFWRAKFTIEGSNYIFDAEKYDLDQGGQGWNLRFGLQSDQNGPLNFQNTGTGNQYQVYASVFKCIGDLLKVYGDSMPLVFEAYDNGRKALYTRFARKYLKTWTLDSTGDDFIAYPPNWEPQEEDDYDGRYDW